MPHDIYCIPLEVVLTCVLHIVYGIYTDICFKSVYVNITVRVVLCPIRLDLCIFFYVLVLIERIELSYMYICIRLCMY
jgi:hypothetical protein